MVCTISSIFVHSVRVNVQLPMMCVMSYRSLEFPSIILSFSSEWKLDLVTCSCDTVAIEVLSIRMESLHIQCSRSWTRIGAQTERIHFQQQFSSIGPECYVCCESMIWKQAKIGFHPSKPHKPISTPSRYVNKKTNVAFINVLMLKLDTRVNAETMKNRINNAFTCSCEDKIAVSKWDKQKCERNIADTWCVCLQMVHCVQCTWMDARLDWAQNHIVFIQTNASLRLSTSIIRLKHNSNNHFNQEDGISQFWIPCVVIRLCLW